MEQYWLQKNMKNNPTKVLGVIPARIGSTRIPGKMLADICGKPLIQRTIERTLEAKKLDALIVSTDSEDVASAAQVMGVEVFMTQSELPTGTDRVAATLSQFTAFTPDIVVNVWGDEPLYPAHAIDDCIEELIQDENIDVALAGDVIKDLSMLEEDSIVKALTDLKNNVLLFSRASVPHAFTNSPYTHHHVIGLMAMRKGFLDTFLTLPRTPIEKLEGVEQMRILEHGYMIRMVKGDFENLGVNMPEELDRVREIFKQRLEEKE